VHNLSSFSVFPFRLWLSARSGIERLRVPQPADRTIADRSTFSNKLGSFLSAAASLCEVFLFSSSPSGLGAAVRAGSLLFFVEAHPLCRAS